MHMNDQHFSLYEKRDILKQNFEAETMSTIFIIYELHVRGPEEVAEARARDRLFICIYRYSMYIILKRRDCVRK